MPGVLGTICISFVLFQSFVWKLRDVFYTTESIEPGKCKFKASYLQVYLRTVDCLHLGIYWQVEDKK